MCGSHLFLKTDFHLLDDLRETFFGPCSTYFWWAVSGRSYCLIKYAECLWKLQHDKSSRSLQNDIRNECFKRLKIVVFDSRFVSAGISCKRSFIGKFLSIFLKCSFLPFCVKYCWIFGWFSSTQRALLYALLQFYR